MAAFYSYSGKLYTSIIILDCFEVVGRLELALGKHICTWRSSINDFIFRWFIFCIESPYPEVNNIVHVMKNVAPTILRQKRFPEVLVVFLLQPHISKIL
jgi:hypothetical protein